MSRFTSFGGSGLERSGGTEVHAVLVSNNELLAGQWFQIFDKASAPAANDVPVFSWFVQTGTTTVIESGFFATAEVGTLSTGLAWGWSSTENEYTAVAGSARSCTIGYSP